MRFASELENVEVIRTNTFLDRLSGVGGIPRRSITEVFGEAGVGKSTLCLQAIAEAQKNGIKCVWADIEFSYAPRYAAELGVDNKKLGIIRATEEVDTPLGKMPVPTAESNLNEILETIANEKVDLIVLDSVGALIPRSEFEKKSGEKTIGGQAGLIAVFCRKVVPMLYFRNTALVVINHAFTDIMTGSLKTSGGEKLNYHKSLSIRLKVNLKKPLVQGEKKVGKVVIGEVWKKNKHAPTEGMVLESAFIYGKGFFGGMDLLEEAIERGIITQQGRTYFMDGEKLCSGMPNLRKMMEDENFAAKLKERLNEKGA